ncbi:MAG: hypothetical protein A3H44_05970 [Gammaproteobacteria bacterium RIFCSPLOWO2_02_FULL_57_10]|nr:MAG: hypothetical protein A3H44_05970 [Gammaproteobacteria bacterium RIFCSPLOWO2_02_FULL_57_10]
MPCSVREATPNDEQQIRALLSLVIHESLDATVHNIPSILNNVNDNVDLWRTAPDNIVHLVAEMDGRLVGVIMIKEFWNFCSLFVDPSYQRRGIGRQLVKIAVEKCRGRCPHDVIYMHANNEAVDFYRKLGFEVNNTSRTPPAGSTEMKLRLV